MLLRGLVTLVSILAAPLTVNGDFVRGDADRSGSVNISDAVIQLLHIFGSDGAMPCEDAADANDDGRLDITDPVVTLGFLFERPRRSLVVGLAFLGRASDGFSSGRGSRESRRSFSSGRKT